VVESGAFLCSHVFELYSSFARADAHAPAGGTPALQWSGRV